MVVQRIKQAESAISDGRLDEAFLLCANTDAAAREIRENRRGQELIGDLARALAARAKTHLLADRTDEALRDCVRAQQVGGSTPEIAELRAAIDEIGAKQRRLQRNAVQLIAAARQHIEQGRLESGEAILASSQAPVSQAGVLLRDATDRRQRVDLAIDRARAAIERGDHTAAIGDLLAARKTNVADPRITDLCSELTHHLRTQATASLEAGRLDEADWMIQRLGQIDGQSVQTRNLQRSLRECRTAWDLIQQGRPGQAVELLRRLSVRFNAAKWITEAAEHAAQAESAMLSLRSGALGLLSDVSVRYDEPVLHDEPTKVPLPAVTNPLPSRFMLQVDGIGAFLVVKTPSVSIGPISSSRLPDIALVTEPNTPLVRIERTQDDYFLRGSAMVNDRPVQDKLLTRADRIATSPRCRFSFDLPNPSSTTAVLDLTGTRYPRSDVRRVILLDRDLIIGPGSAAHVRADGLSQNLVLNLRDGALFHGGRLIDLDTPFTAGDVSLVLVRA